MYFFWLNQNFYCSKQLPDKVFWQAVENFLDILQTFMFLSLEPEMSRLTDLVEVKESTSLI
jgi:hypothetical protein